MLYNCSSNLLIGSQENPDGEVKSVEGTFASTSAQQISWNSNASALVYGIATLVRS